MYCTKQHILTGTEPYRLSHYTIPRYPFFGLRPFPIAVEDDWLCVGSFLCVLADIFIKNRYNLGLAPRRLTTPQEARQPGKTKTKIRVQCARGHLHWILRALCAVHRLFPAPAEVFVKTPLSCAS